MPVSNEVRKIHEKFSQELEIFTVVTHELKLASLHELQTIYDTEDLFDLLEIIEVHGTLTKEAQRQIPKA